MVSAKYWKLNEDKQPVECGLLEWGEFFGDDEKRRVAYTQTEHFEVSTVFLGLDHSFGRNGPPILFETMIFNRAVAGATESDMREILKGADCFRYASWDDAETGHATAVRRVLLAESFPAAEIERFLADMPEHLARHFLDLLPSK